MNERAPSFGLTLLAEELEEFQRKIAPKAPFPPPCFTSMEGRFLDYKSRTSLKVSFPVKADTLNPEAAMQGGFVTAAFDNVFGPLSYLAARNPCKTLDIHTQFIRSIREGDTLIVTANVIGRGTGTIFMTAEAMNSTQRLIATSSTNLLIVRRQDL
ncbi:MAG TPA: PaaI family thioesterase [Bacteroidota bacterium]|nr:PaaI family thioesterase [Bacteroidota bacterium]